MSERNEEMFVRRVSKTSLIPAKEYQRDLNQGTILKIRGNFELLRFRPITCSRRKDGSLYIIDGQTRFEAVKNMKNIEMVPVIIHGDLSLPEEAGLFVALNSDGVKVGRFFVFRAKKVSGDTTALYIQSVLDESGLTLVKSAKKGRQVAAIEKIESIQEGLTQEEFKAIMTMVAKLCKDRPVSRRLLAGIASLKRDKDFNITDFRVQSKILKAGIDKIEESIDEVCLKLKNAGEKTCGIGIARAL